MASAALVARGHFLYNKKMLNESRIKFLEQTRGLGSCGPVSLQIVLAYFGIEKTEQELVALCGTTSKEGTDYEAMIGALEELNLKTQTGSWQSVEESWASLNYWINEKGVPVIVNWFSTFGDNWQGHYSVAYRIDKDFIWLANPEFYTAEERNQKLSWVNFAVAWFDFRGEVMAKPEEVTARWWLVAYPKDSKI